MAERKKQYFKKLVQYLDEYPKILLVNADNVGSNQLQQIRIALRGKAELLMGKNTMMRKAIKGHLAQNPDLENLLPHIVGNIGFLFSKENLKELREKIAEHKVQAAARVGAVAPCSYVIPAGNTTLDPSMTSFMQALSINTRINKGCIEIINDVQIIVEGEKVTSSQAALLQKLDIKPFKYGLVPTQVYDSGVCYPPSLLDLDENEVIKKFTFAVQRVAALSLKINFPTRVAVPHIFARSYQNLVAVSLATDYTFDRIKEMKELLSNPEALAALAASSTTSTPAQSAPAPAKEGAKEAPKPAAKEPEPEPEEEEEEGFGDLFG